MSEPIDGLSPIGLKETNFREIDQMKRFFLVPMIGTQF